MKLVQAHYTRDEVKLLIAEAVQRAVKQDREVHAQILRSMPVLTSQSNQHLIEKPARLRRILERELSPVDNENIVDTDVDPGLPDGDFEFEVSEHYCVGKLKWHRKNFRLFRTRDQVTDGGQRGKELSKEVRSRPRRMNAAFLDWLLSHQDKIPEKCKEVKVCFAGTIYYSRPLFETRMRYMYYDGRSYCGSSVDFDTWFSKDYSFAEYCL